MKSKYITNDSRIRTASRQLRQGRLSIKSFLLRCSFTVAGYEERMRFMALGQNNIEPLLMNDDNLDVTVEEPAYNVEEPLVNEGVHNINADNLFDNLDVTVEEPAYNVEEPLVNEGVHNINADNLFDNLDVTVEEPAYNVEEPLVNEGVHNINADNLFDNLDVTVEEPAYNVEEPLVNEGVHNINANNSLDIDSENSDSMIFVRRRRRIFSITDDESENESNRYGVENPEVPQHEPHINIFDEFPSEYNGELDLQGVEAVVDQNNVDVVMLLDNDPGNIN
ncbi:probable basic-leucine zipper transcription factor S [Acyrthosiphon pisum]|uniref:Uncharacterized protein n=1 Tax=Acyrthosiphon pisum TaxID=7029 RepID=A0A8R2JUM8_ACYPI|nr:probable basic-leucine zipper transcription factor S [Acyrthosiphon pisum]